MCATRGRHNIAVCVAGRSPCAPMPIAPVVAGRDYVKKGHFSYVQVEHTSAALGVKS
jgi:hypothetical protein